MPPLKRHNKKYNKKPQRGSRKTYTKKMMSRIIAVALIDMQFPFVLAFLDKKDIAETLGGLIVTEIIGVFLVYCAKSFFETRESEKIRIAEEQQTEEPEEPEESEDSI